MSDDLYKDLYDAEWVRRDQLQSAVAVPVGLLALLGGGIVLYIQKYEGPAILSTVFFWCCIAVGAACYAVAAVQLVRSYHGYTYERIPWPSQIWDHHQRLLEYHAATGGDSVEPAAFQEAWQHVRGRFDPSKPRAGLV